MKIGGGGLVGRILQQTPVVAPSYQGIGDIAAATGYWGVRAYSAAVAGSATKLINVLDVTQGSNTYDLTSNSDGSINMTPLSGITGHTFSVQALYDQTGGGNDMTSFSATHPVFIANVTQPYIQNQGGGVYGQTPSLTLTDPISYVAFANLVTNTSGMALVNESNFGNSLILQYNSYGGGGGDIVGHFRFHGTSIESSSHFAPGHWHGLMGSASGGGTAVNVAVDGVTTVGSSYTSFSYTGDHIVTGDFTAITDNMNYTEIVYYTSDKVANFSALYTNMANFWTTLT